MAHVAGKAVINIVPSMKGFRSAVNREISTLGRASGMKFGTSLDKGLSSIKFKTFDNFTPLTKLTSQSDKTVGNLTKIFNKLPTAVQPAVNRVNATFQKITASSAFQKISTQVSALSGKINAGFSKINVGGITSKFSAGFGKLGGIAKIGMAGAVGAVSAGIGAIGAVISSQLPSAIQRFDMLNRFPKVLENLNIPAQQAEDALKRLEAGAQGLPTTTDAMATAFMQFAGKLTSGKTTEYVADLTVALNDMALAGGASAEDAARGMLQFTQMLNTGTVDAMSWRTAMEVMPGQLNQLAQSLLGPTANADTLYQALQNGTISMDTFESAIISMSQNGGAGFASFHQQALTASAGIDTSYANLKTSVRNLIADMIPEDASSKIDTLTEKIKTFQTDLQKSTETQGSSSGGLLAMLGFDDSSIGSLETFFEQIRTQVESFFTSFAEGFSFSGFSFDDLTSSFGTLSESLTSFFETIQPVTDFIGTAVGFVLGLLLSLVTFVINTFARIISIVTNVITFVTTIPEKVSSIIETVKTFVSNGISNIVDFFTGLPEKIKTAIGKVASIGSNIIDGIVNGVKNAAGRLVSAAKDAVTGALNAAKSVLGIHSPSRVFRDIVGKNISAGIAVGIESNSSMIDGALASAVDVTSVATDMGGVPVTSVMGAPVNGTVGNVTFNIYESNPHAVASIVLNRLNAKVR